MKNTADQNIISSQQKNSSVEQETAYSTARKRQLGWMEQGFDMGTEGRASWTREELHNR